MDPLTYYLDSRTPLGIAKDVTNVILPLILDTIIVSMLSLRLRRERSERMQVYRTYIVYEMRVQVVLMPVCLLLLNIGDFVWFVGCEVPSVY